MNKKSILMIYDNQWNVPNGDPFTGTQRMDEATNKALVSDLRIKRFIRDGFSNLLDEDIFYKYDKHIVKKFINEHKSRIKSASSEDAKEKTMSGASAAYNKYIIENNLVDDKGNVLDGLTTRDILLRFIDCRIFGGVLSERRNTESITGALQFKNLNASINKVSTYTMQNTCVFPSEVKNDQGAIGTTELIPYSIFAIEGWVDEETAKLNHLTQVEVDKALSALWLGIKDKNTKSKTSQNPILLLEIDYKPYEYKYNKEKQAYKSIKDLSSLITLDTEIEEEDIRFKNDYTLNLNKLIKSLNSENVDSVSFYSEENDLIEELSKNVKFKFKDVI